MGAVTPRPAAGSLPDERAGGVLVCPETRQPLELIDLEAAEDALAGGDALVARSAASGPPPVGPTASVLLRKDGLGAYPITDGVPVLMLPEVLVSPGASRSFDLNDPRWAEAYEEMAHYNGRSVTPGQRDRLFGRIEPVMTGPARETFPVPLDAWIDNVYDGGSQEDAYRYLQPLEGQLVLQIGGTAIHAIKFLLAGAAEAWHATPMLSEALLSLRLAEAAGVADRFHAVLAVGEQLPFADGSFGRIYSGGSIHHTTTEQSFPEIRRVLEPGGRFAAVEPWRAPLYGVGIRVFGKRERNVHCRPMTAERVAPLYSTFPVAAVMHHGTFTRYPLLALAKAHMALPRSAVRAVLRADDRICSASSWLRAKGSSVALLAQSP